MGLTVHYSGGKAESKEKINELFKTLESVAKSMGWEYWYERVNLHNATLVKGYEEQLSGLHTINHKTININMDEGCETFSIGFDLDRLTFNMARQWNKNRPVINLGGFFCKTQYSKNFEETHHTICMLLDTIKKTYVKDMEISDEGGYYGVWDKKALGEEIKEWDRMIRGFSDRLKTAFKDNPNIEILEQPKIQNGKIVKN